VPTLSPGTHVSTSKNDIIYVVTEYGVAQLRGKSVKQRAEALIGIAHPDVRSELREAAKKMNLLETGNLDQPQGAFRLPVLLSGECYGALLKNSKNEG
jgi:acyl-CoA hydrolase